MIIYCQKCDRRFDTDYEPEGCVRCEERIDEASNSTQINHITTIERVS